MAYSLSILPQVRVVEPDDYEASEQSVDEARLFTGRVDQFLNHAQVLRVIVFPYS